MLLVLFHCICIGHRRFVLLHYMLAIYIHFSFAFWHEFLWLLEQIFVMNGTNAVVISKAEYLRLKQQAEIDLGFLKDLFSSVADIRSGRVKQVR